MRLLRASPQETVDLLAEMEREARALHEQITEICFFMKGSLDYHQAWNLSLKEIKIVQKQIKNYFEMVKKTGLAF